MPEVPESRLDVVERRSVTARIRVQVRLMEYMLISTDLEEDCGNCVVSDGTYILPHLVSKSFR